MISPAGLGDRGVGLLFFHVPSEDACATSDTEDGDKRFR